MNLWYININTPYTSNYLEVDKITAFFRNLTMNLFRLPKNIVVKLSNIFESNRLLSDDLLLNYCSKMFDLFIFDYEIIRKSNKLSSS